MTELKKALLSKIEEFENHLKNPDYQSQMEQNAIIVTLRELRYLDSIAEIETEKSQLNIGTASGSAINFTANFKNLKKEAPVVKAGMCVEVYFICEGILYKGTYHINEQFYAYKILGGFDCFASKSGSYDTFSGKEENKICTHWCYVDELKMLSSF